jgi:type II secretory pathway predicted ATPase ExeA
MQLTDHIEQLKQPPRNHFWLGPAQQRALTFLDDPARGPHRALIAPRRAGKTTLVAEWLKRRDSSTIVLLGTAASSDRPAALLHGFLSSVGLGESGTSEVERRNLLSVFVQHQLGRGRRVVLIVDDAEQLHAPLKRELERLLRLSDLPRFETLLIGHADLGPKLLELKPGIHIHGMPPLRPEFACNYLRARLNLNSQPDQLPFTPVAAQALARQAAGSMERLDRLALQALERALAGETTKVGVRLAQEVLEEEHRVPSRDRATTGSLLLSRDGKLIREIPLTDRVLVGRSEHNDVELRDPAISRHHVLLVGTPAGHYVIDLNSANGIAVNSHSCRHAALREGDVIGIGPYRIKVSFDRVASPDDPLPDNQSLADTGIMLAAETAPELRRIK